MTKLGQMINKGSVTFHGVLQRMFHKF